MVTRGWVPATAVGDLAGAPAPVHSPGQPHSCGQVGSEAEIGSSVSFFLFLLNYFERKKPNWMSLFLIYIFERQSEGGRERQSLPPTGSFCKRLQCLGLGQELSLGLSHGSEVQVFASGSTAFPGASAGTWISNETARIQVGCLLQVVA